MAKTEEVRRIEKRTKDPLKTPTVPSSSDHTDGNWIETDIYEGELYVILNGEETAIFLRHGQTIVKFSKDDPTNVGLYTREKNQDGTVTWTPVASNLNNLTDTHVERLIDLVFISLQRSGSAIPSTFERDVPTDVTFSYSITNNDDVVTYVDWNGTVTISEPFPLTGQDVATGISVTTTRTLRIQTEGNDPADLIIVSTALTPQWRGSSSVENLTMSYATLNTELNKVVQSNDNMTYTFSLNGTYYRFISTNPNATISQGQFSLIIGTWGDGVSEIYKRTVSVSLANGAVVSMTEYRSREVKTGSITLTLT